MTNSNNIDYDKYLDKLAKRIFYILPMLEKEDGNVDKYVNSLLIELNGAVRNFDNNPDLIGIIFNLQGIQGMEITDRNVWRSKVLECFNTINKIKKQEVKKEETK